MVHCDKPLLEFDTLKKYAISCMIGPSIHPPSQPRFVNQLADDDAYVHFVESRIRADRGTKGQTISLSFSH